jgi:hypothetical protein
MNTYFIVVASADRPEFVKELGPYISYEDAAIMMVDHLREILYVETGAKLSTYTAKIVEVYYTQTCRKELVVKTTEEVTIT